MPEASSLTAETLKSKMSKILYLHGFGSCGESQKSNALKEYFGREAVIAPDLFYAPKDAIAQLEEIIQREDIGLLIGSSLGGFYATFLAEKFALPTILLNPSVEPWITLKPYIGWQERFCDGERFAFKASYIDDLKALRTLPLRSAYLVLLQSGDETLDYTVAKNYYKRHRVVVECGGNHRFENIEDYLCMIEKLRR